MWSTPVPLLTKFSRYGKSATFLIMIMVVQDSYNIWRTGLFHRVLDHLIYPNALLNKFTSGKVRTSSSCWTMKLSSFVVFWIGISASVFVWKKKGLLWEWLYSTRTWALRNLIFGNSITTVAYSFSHWLLHFPVWYSRPLGITPCSFFSSNTHVRNEKHAKHQLLFV